MKKEKILKEISRNNNINKNTKTKIFKDKTKYTRKKKHKNVRY